MTEQEERHEMQRTRGRIDQLLDEVGELLVKLRSEIEQERHERQGDGGGGA